MIPSIEEIDRIACLPQKNEDGTVNKDWRRSRLGCFTSSEISDLMVLSPEEKAYNKLLAEGTVKLPKKIISELMTLTGKSEQDVIRCEYTKQLNAAKEAVDSASFTGTALSYILSVSSERNMRKVFIEDDTLFDFFIQRTELTNRDMKWGNEMEPYARQEYMQITHNEVVEIGFRRSSKIDWLGDSPDGLVVDKETGKPIGCIEIKCPKPNTWMLYKYSFSKGKKEGKTSNEILKEIKPEYYWQCQCHCECNNLPWCDFIYYDQMQNDGLQVERIYRCQEDIDNMTSRVVKANKFIDNEILK